LGESDSGTSSERPMHNAPLDYLPPTWLSVCGRKERHTETVLACAKAAIAHSPVLLPSASVWEVFSGCARGGWSEGC
jgi:hypothetical protein